MIMFAMAGAGGGGNLRRKSSEDSVQQVALPKEPTTTTTDTKSPAQKVRKDFPDTWLWFDGTTTENGQFRTQVRLPDTITSWHVSAFGVNENGLVASGGPFELTAFQPFFVSLNLPYSIKRGEAFSLRVTVFNYRAQAVNAIIRMEMSDDFILTGGKPKNNYMEFPVVMLPNLASVVTYQVNASTIGKVDLHVVAEDLDDPNQRDEVIRKLLVKSPGEARDKTITDVLLLVDRESYTKTFSIDWPYGDIIDGSQRLQVKVTGQVLGQSLSNLDNLVMQPTGCGEQNMIGLVPNIYGATYIVQTGQQDSMALVKKMIDHMNSGYQRQVDLYQKKDGSYSAWGNDPVGSTWLTAFVVKSFAAASKFIQVDDEVLQSAVNFLASKQNSNGYFREDGRVIHSNLKEGTGEDLPMTIYCLLSLLETSETNRLSSLDINLQPTIRVILNEVSQIVLKSQEKPFLSAMTVYTLSLAQTYDPLLKVDDAITTLLEFIEGSNVPWLMSSNKQETPTTLMTAAYTLLTYLRQDKMDKAFDVMKWLQARQNSKGGFGSTQDTVLVLQSLSEFGLRYKNIQPSGTVEVSVPGTSFRESLDISGSRSILLQQLDLPANNDVVNVTLTGDTNTVAFVKVVMYYNTPVLPQTVQLSRGAQVDVITKSRTLTEVNHEVEACMTSTLDQGVGMYVTTMNLPTGEVPIETVLQMKSRNPHVSHVEVEDEGVLHFYMNDIPAEGCCVKAMIERQMEIEMQQPGSAVVYSYYEPEYYKESEIVLSEAIDCRQEDGPCGSAPGLSLASLVLTVLICLMSSLLACL